MIPDLPPAVVEVVVRYGGTIICDLARDALWVSVVPKLDADRVSAGVFYEALESAEGWDFPGLESVRSYASGDPLTLRQWVARQRSLYPDVRIVG